MFKRVIIIGAGPAGLTAAYEFLHHSDISPIILESNNKIGGLSKTVNYKGNYIDIGGHLFSSKSDKINKWWGNILTFQLEPDKNDTSNIEFPFLSHVHEIEIPEDETLNSLYIDNDDDVMFLREFNSKMLFGNKFFNLPISLDIPTIMSLGLIKTFKIGLSYFKTSFFPIKSEKSLEDVLINRFTKELYLTLLKDYSEKVWGVSCKEINADWGYQGVMSMKFSFQMALRNALKNIFSRNTPLTHKNIQRPFMYPKYGSGQLWEKVANIILEKGGMILPSHRVVGVRGRENRIISVDVIDGKSSLKTIEGDYFISTMPINDLINSFKPNVPFDVMKVAQGLMYRDFIIIGLLLNKSDLNYEIDIFDDLVPIQSIYIPEKDLKLIRLQIFNNWSSYMVNNENKVWLGLEYICTRGDELWNMSKQEFARFAIEEIDMIGIIKKKDVVDYIVIKEKNAYPLYAGTYNELSVVQDYIRKFDNLFLMGRNGKHSYYSMSESMLDSINTVDQIIKTIKKWLCRNHYFFYLKLRFFVDFFVKKNFFSFRFCFFLFSLEITATYF